MLAFKYGFTVRNFRDARDSRKKTMEKGEDRTRVRKLVGTYYDLYEYTYHVMICAELVMTIYWLGTVVIIVPGK